MNCLKSEISKIALASEYNPRTNPQLDVKLFNALVITASAIMIVKKLNHPNGNFRTLPVLIKALNKKTSFEKSFT